MGYEVENSKKHNQQWRGWRDGDSIAVKVWRDNIVVHGQVRTKVIWWLSDDDVISKEQG